MRVLKFGGSVLRTPESVRAVVDVVRGASARGPIIVVVSALYHVTDQLQSAVDAALHGKRAVCHGLLQRLFSQHQEILSACVSTKFRRTTQQRIEALLAEAREVCDGVAQVRECTARTLDRMLGFGELCSAEIVAAVLQSVLLSASAIDARTFIVTDDQFGSARVLMRPTREKFARERRAWKKNIPVVTGFIAATADGIPTTVGRNGTDYTASLLGALAQAQAIEIWKEVDGVMSADPALVEEAFVIPELTYAEAMEMAYFGAKVLHPQSVIPAVEAGIPIHIRDVFHPEKPGTRISHRRGTWAHHIAGITSMNDVSLLSLEGAGMIGVVGVAGRLFAALAHDNINVILISQGSSEQSICCVIARSDGERARRVVRTAFVSEFRRQLIRRVVVREDIAVVAVVGSAMRGTPGIAARLFTALGKNAINVMAVAQGSSELNISLVMLESDRARALNVLHGAFHLAERLVHVVVIGKGTIGKQLLAQIAQGQTRLEKDSGLRLRVVGIAGRDRLLFDAHGIALAQWPQKFSRSAQSFSAAGFGAWLRAQALANLIVVDATASDDIARCYPEWMKRGVSIVTPNKRANTFSQKFYDELQRLVRRRNAYYLYETCVGAGLPVISTLQDLIDSGDAILKIEATLSGTLGFIFSELSKGAAFSHVVQVAMQRGYTEPDPRDDLSGMDVARKLLILARKMGVRTELSRVRVEPLLPKKLRSGGSVEKFLQALPQIDALYAKKSAAAARTGKVLRYIGEVTKQGCSVGLRAVEATSAFGSLRGGDNMVVFTTQRYRTNPLIVRGPGAGPAVTAGGIFADILKIANLLTT